MIFLYSGLTHTTLSHIKVPTANTFSVSVKVGEKQLRALRLKMHIFAVLLTLLYIRTSAIEFVLLEDNDSDTDDDPALTCFDFDYDSRCGSFTTANPDSTITGQLYGAAAVSMGSTAIQNTPTLRAYNEGGHPVNICASIRASWLLLDDSSSRHVPLRRRCGSKRFQWIHGEIHRFDQAIWPQSNQ
jgi:hypothetical protein